MIISYVTVEQVFPYRDLIRAARPTLREFKAKPLLALTRTAIEADLPRDCANDRYWPQARNTIVGQRVCS
jgi:hypothetical protein